MLTPDASWRFAWTPTAEQLAHANVTRLARALGCDGDFASLQRLAVGEPDRFWRAVRDDLDIPFFEDWHTVLDASGGPQWATWFLGSRVNVAEKCVHRWAESAPATRLRSGGRRTGPGGR